MGDLERDRKARRRGAKAGAAKAPEPGKYANTDNYGQGGPGVSPNVPGKTSATEGLPSEPEANEPGKATAAEVSARGDAGQNTDHQSSHAYAGAVGSGSQLFAFGAGAQGTTGQSAGADGASETRSGRSTSPERGGGAGQTDGAARAARENFEVRNWRANENAQGLRVGSPRGNDAAITVQSDGIAASASVRALTTEAQRYSVGFVQTIHHSRRLAIYESGPGVVANTWLATRGEMLDQRTDIRSPMPWYNYGLSLGSAARTPGMTDNPTVQLPLQSPEYATIARLEGSESFTTYLVVMVDNDPATIIYLGNVRWSVNWSGRFQANYSRFDGGDARVGGARESSRGGAVLQGPAANHGPDGRFVGASGGRRRARGRHGADAAADAYAWGTYGNGEGGYGYGDPPADDAARVQTLRTAIADPLKPIAAEFERSATPATIDRGRLTAFRYLFDRNTQFQTLTAYLMAVPASRLLLEAMLDVDRRMTEDRERVAEIERAISQVVGGGQAADATGVCMVAYQRMSVTARRFLRERPLVQQLHDMPEPTAHAPPTMNGGSGASRDERSQPPSPARALYRLVHGDMSGVLAIDAAAAAAPAADAATLPPEVRTAFTELKQRILREVPAAAPDAPPPSHQHPGADRAVLTALQTALRDADSRVRDLLARDPEVQGRLVQVLNTFELRQLNTALDSVEGLADQVQPPYQQGQQVAPPPNRFALLRDFLAQRPGAANADLRQRVLAHGRIGPIINALPETEKETILRLVARGTDQADPVDAIYAAARGTGTGEDALRGAMQLTGNRDRLAQLRSDLMFRQALDTDRNRSIANVDGLTVSVRDYMARAWGETPNASAEDPASALARPWVNPTPEDTTPPTPQEWQRINTIIDTAVQGLAPRLRSVFWAADGWTEDAPIVEILLRYERECAAEDVRSLFRRANKAPGAELVRRANADSRIGDIQTRLYRCLSEQNRQVGERVLGLRANAAAIGQIGTQVRLPEDDLGIQNGERRVPLQQALAEITIDNEVQLAERSIPRGATLAQLIRGAAEEMCRELDEFWGADTADITQIRTNYTRAFDAKKGELARQTGMQEAQLHAIDLLSNAYREVPGGRGDLRAHIEAALGRRSGATVQEMGLNDEAVRERAGQPRTPPDQAFRSAGEPLWNAIRNFSEPGVGDDPTNDALTTASSERTERAARVREAFEATRRVEAAPGQPAAAAAPPVRPAGQGPAAQTGAPAGAPAAGTPTTMVAWYHQTYGIDPERHVIELARASYRRAAEQVREHNRYVERMSESDRRAQQQSTLPAPDLGAIGAAFGVPAGRIDMAITATAEPMLQEAAADERRTAEAAADRLWRAVHGEGDIVAIRRDIDGKRNQERQLILAAFRERSGGIELDFYLRQAVGYGRQIGAEGVRAAGAAVGETAASVRGDQGSLEETLAVAQTGTVGFTVRIQVALRNTDRNELFRLLDNATVEERRAVLGSPDLLAQMRQRLGEEDYDRAYATLNGTATLVTRLRSRADGSTGMDADSSGLNGMQRDIRDWVARRNEFYIREREAGRHRFTNEQIRDRVRIELQQQFSDPALRSIIDDECRNWWDAEGEGADLENRILNGGDEQHVSSLLSGDTFISVDNVITQLGQMTPAERDRLRTNPEFLRRLEQLDPSPYDRARIFDAMRGTGDSAEDHIGQLNALLRGTGGADEILVAIGRLGHDEYRRVTADPTLVNRIMTRLQYDQAAVARARQMLSFNPTTQGDRTGILGTNFASNPVPGEITQEERTRLAFLQHQATSMIRAGSYRSYEALCREAVEVYRMDFRPRATNIPNAPAPAVPADETHQASMHRLQAPTAVERQALEMRRAVWTDELAEVVLTCVRSNRVDGQTEQSQVAAIEEGVKGTRDPSLTLVTNLVAPGFWGDNSWSVDEDAVKTALRGASDQLIVDEWASVVHPAFEGSEQGRSLLQAYNAYRETRNVPLIGGAQDRARVDQARLAFQRYRIQPSTHFENLVLRSTRGPLGGRDTNPTGSAEQNATRDNPIYMEYRSIMHERIRTLDMSLVARKIGADGPDAEVLSSGVRTAEQGLAAAQEAHGQQRAGGSTAFGANEGRQMDRAMGDYHRAVHAAEDQTAGARSPDGSFQDISSRDQRGIAAIDADFQARRADFQAAREKAAEMAAIVVGVLVGVILTALLPGAGSVAAMALYSAMVSAAAATGQVLTREAILGNTYDAGGDGLKTIAVAAATGAIAGGAQFYSGQVVNALAGGAAGGTAAQQLTALATGVNRAAPAWQQILQEGGKAGLAATFTGLANTAGAALDPNVWLHGWNEGFYRARNAAGQQIRRLPGEAVRSAISSMASTAATRGLQRAGMPDGPGPLRPGEVPGMRRVGAQLAADLPGNIVDAGVNQAMQGPQTPGDFARGMATSVAQSAQDVGQSMHGQSISTSRQEQHARLHIAREVLAHQDQFTNGTECELFQRAVMGVPEGGRLPTAPEFIAARNHIAGANAGPELSPTQREAFVRWVRSGPVSEFQARAARNPLEIPEVANAAATAPAAAATATTPRGQSVRQQATAARTAAQDARMAANDADLAEGVYDANQTAAVAAQQLERMSQALERARDAKRRADEAVTAADSASRGEMSAEERAEVTAALDEARRAAAEAETMVVLIGLGRARLLSASQAPAAGQPQADAGGTPPPRPADAAPPTQPRPPEIRPNELSPEDNLLYHSLVQQHGQEQGSRRFREHQERRMAAQLPNADINASMVQGSEFVGHGRTAAAPAEVMAAATTHLNSADLAAMIPGVESITQEGAVWRVRMHGNGEFQIRVTSVSLGAHQVARSYANSEAGVHNIQVNDRAADTNIRRAIAHEIAELAGIQRQFMAGAVPRTTDALTTGALVPNATLSYHDLGRVAELNVLCGELAAATSSGDRPNVLRLRRELTALVERLGLREGPEGNQRMALIRGENLLNAAADRQLASLRLPTEALATEDRAALDQFRTRSQEQQGLVDAQAARERALSTPGEVPVPDGPDGRVSLQRAEQMATQAAARRAARSEAIVREYRAMRAREGEPYPRAPHHILLGGGASVAALTPGTLFIDSAGRWHLDASGTIAQTPQQIGDMPGLGNAEQFAPDSENGRLRLHAVRFMIDNAAAQARCINGRAAMAMEGVHMVLTITPQEGGEPIKLLVDPSHVPVIATGFPIENAPRPRSAAQTTEAVSRVRARLNSLGILPDSLRTNPGTSDAEAAAWGNFLNERVPDPNPPAPAPGQPAPTEPPMIRRGDLIMRGLSEDDGRALAAATTTLGCVAAWHEQNSRFGFAAQGANATVLRGDEASLINFGDHPNTTWIIAGMGGTAISIAENILNQTRHRPDVKVRMLGIPNSQTLETNTQWRQVLAAHAEPGAFPEFPNGDGRLILGTQEVAALTRNADGTFSPNADAGAARAGGYIAALGRDGVIPAPIASLVATELQRAQERNPSAPVSEVLRGHLMHDTQHDGQFLGYALEVLTEGGWRRFEVTGASSRFLPSPPFTQQQQQDYLWEDRVQSQRDAPAGAGRFAGGFSASAQQAARYGQWRREQEEAGERPTQ